MLIGVACGSGNGGPASLKTGSPPDQEQVTAGVSVEAPADNAPQIPHGAPLVTLTYEGAVYYQTPLSTDDAANLNVNDLELVGATSESNLLLPAGNELRRFIVDLNRANLWLAQEHSDDRIDLLLTDLVMPLMGGKELAVQFKLEHPETKVLYFSGYSDDTGLGQVGPDERISLLEKPFTPASLAQEVRHALDDSALPRPP